MQPDAVIDMSAEGLSEPDEATLLVRCKSEDPAAFRELYDLHVQAVLRTARRLGLPPAEAEDVTQEVFTTAFQDLHRVAPGGLASWLFRITSNRAHDWHRRQRVREAFGRLFAPAEEPRTESDPESEFLQASDEARVARILGRMGHKKRDVFVLYEIEGRSGPEIAGIVGASVHTVWSRLNHARRDFIRLSRALDVLDDAKRMRGQS